MKTIYLDNGATSFPKPETVGQSMLAYISGVGETINRSVYGSAQSAGLVALQLRESLATFFNLNESPTQVVLTPGATASLNMVIKGLLKDGDHCIVSGMEHNAVIRPLFQLDNVSHSVIPCDSEGRINTDEVEKLIQPNTKLCIVCHASNVCGTIQDVKTIGQICKKHNVPFVLDGAQSAGHIPIDFKELSLSALCVPAHKGLLGPSGIGALLLTPQFTKRLTPLIAGGTGSASDSEYLPHYMPDRFESGTPNVPGIYGWEASMRYINEQGLSAIHAHEMALTKLFLEGVSKIEGVRLCGVPGLEDRVAVISLDFINHDNGDISYKLESEFNILTRCGLHCSPFAHRSLGTFPRGTVRFSIGYFNTEDDITTALMAIKKLSEA